VIGLAWAGHWVCMDSDGTLKKIFNTKPDGATSVGRPKLQWEDGVDQDMRILGVKNWKKFTLNETIGKSFLKRPGPTRGCRANDDDDSCSPCSVCNHLCYT
jgi:hypothetical protein